MAEVFSDLSLINDEYLSGLFDAEGWTNLTFSENSKLKMGIAPKPIVEIKLGHRYFCGLFDGEGNIDVSLLEHPEMAMGIQAMPRMRLVMSNGWQLLSKIKEKYGGHIRKSKVCRNGAEWYVSDLEGVERMADILLRNCIVKRPQLLIMKYIVLPLIKRGEHRTPQGLLALIEIQKRMNSGKGGIKDWREILLRKLKEKGLLERYKLGG